MGVDEQIRRAAAPVNKLLVRATAALLAIPVDELEVGVEEFVAKRRVQGDNVEKSLSFREKPLKKIENQKKNG